MKDIIFKKIKIKTATANTDPTDSMIEQPEFYTLKLFDYQKKTIKWLYDTNKKDKKIPKQKKNNYKNRNKQYSEIHVNSRRKKKTRRTRARVGSRESRLAEDQAASLPEPSPSLPAQRRRSLLAAGSWRF